MKRLAVAMLLSVALVGCGNKEEEVPVETSPALLEGRQVIFDCFGDETLILDLKDVEGLLEVSETSATVYCSGQEVTLDYIEGNSLNDFTKAYAMGLGVATSSEADYSSFTYDGEYYRFIKTENNNYVMAKASSDLDYYCDQLLERIK